MVPISSSTNGAMELEADGRFKLLTIEPAQLWVAYVQIGGSQSALRMEVQLPRGAPFALYGRRNAAPSITQHDFSQFVHDETLMARFRRQLNSSSSPTTSSRPAYYNTSLVKPVEPGRWFLAVYNDDSQRQDVAVGLTLTNEVATPCPDDCNGRGQCLNGKCLCRDGFAGTDCSTSNLTNFPAVSFQTINCNFPSRCVPGTVQWSRSLRWRSLSLRSRLDRSGVRSALQRAECCFQFDRRRIRHQLLDSVLGARNLRQRPLPV